MVLEMAPGNLVRRPGLGSMLAKWIIRDIVSARGHHFLARGLGPGAVVLDLGAHQGEFSAALVAIGCRSIAVEADPVLSTSIAPSERLTVINAAVDAESGSRRFFAYSNPEAGSLYGAENGATRVERISAVTLADVFQQTGIEHANLVKIDIEGAEVALLNSLPNEILRRCDQITVEFHDFCYEHITTAGVERVIERLRSCGFDTISFSRGYTDVLFVRRDAALLRRWEVWYVTAFLRYLLAFGRRLSRRKFLRQAPDR